MTAGEPSILELRQVRKTYGGLRPLRVEALRLQAGQSVAILNVDATAVEVLVDLVTGTALPDEGEVELFGRSTAEIRDGDEWLGLLERFGIVSARVVLLDRMSVVQNLAMPFTLELEPIPPPLADQARRLGAEVGLTGPVLDAPAGAVSPEARARLRLARAIALDPRLLLLEHPTVGLPRDAVDRLATDVRRIAAERRLSVLVLTGDRPFADAAAGDVLTLRPATGELARAGGWGRWFSRSSSS
ncbi:MAG TPA: ATP-binding cassette domain-containing protein [Vicinamibacterales bacterium]|nr:ATP-binding cassette domain-containing protein [Vicinamibacterales bacterium]